MDTTDLPPVAAELLRELAAAGWATVGERRGGMGGVQIVLRGPDAELELSGDRGHWVLLLRVAGLTRGVVPAYWAAYLDGREVRAGDLDLDAQVRFVRDRRAEAVVAVRADPAAEARLTALGTAYLRGRSGG